MNKIFKFKGVFLIIGFLLVSFQTLAQGIVKGTVSSDDGLPLPGVNVIVKGTSNGVQTDFDGNYEIDINKSNAVLVFSYIGFESREISVGNKSVIDVTLQTDQEALDEVVVIGYGSVKKSDLTGAVSSIKAEEMNPGANASIDQALQGRVAGVQISQNSNEPGGGMSINIRGAGSINAGTEPLYVKDGK